MPGIFVQIGVEGIDKVLDQLGPKLENAIVKGAIEGLRDTGLEMETEMKGECPHKSGHLRRNIKAEEPEVEA